MSSATVHRRTFEAAQFPEGSEERARLNLHTLTSEYMPSYRYVVLGGQHDRRATRTKTEAESLVSQEGA